jgi:CDP-6-deoxy-D-xylo-4-hexulose-3-dehydrase
MDIEVSKFEKEMSEFVGCKYSVFVSSGSTANTIIAAYTKDKLNIKKIIFPSTTWTTSISPFVREGIKPVFVDINLKDFSLDLDKVEEALLKDSEIKAIFITSLLGFVPDIERLKKIQSTYNVHILMDNCENTLGKYKGKNISSFFTSSTSTYFGHQVQSVEGGFVFTNNQDEYEYFLMARNHGMVRAISGENKKKYLNSDVNDKFDFFLLGNNYRNSDIHAAIGRLDLKRIKNYFQKREILFNFFKSQLDSKKFILPDIFKEREHSAFCLPIIFKAKDRDINSIIKICEERGIETRPIISGNLLRQTCYKKYGKATNFPNSEHLHKNGFYIGLHPKITENQISEITKILNNL